MSVGCGANIDEDGINEAVRRAETRINDNGGVTRDTDGSQHTVRTASCHPEGD